jgi:hypothetical protein
MLDGTCYWGGHARTKTPRRSYLFKIKVYPSAATLFQSMSAVDCEGETDLLRREAFDGRLGGHRHEGSMIVLRGKTWHPSGKSYGSSVTPWPRVMRVALARETLHWAKISNLLSGKHYSRLAEGIVEVLRRTARH